MRGYKENLLAEICGIHIGDGYLRDDSSGRKELDVSGAIEEKEYYDRHVIPLFSKVLGEKIEGRRFESRNTYGFRIYGENITDFLIDDLGLPNGKKTQIKIPDFIMNSSQDVKHQFLRGLYDTDGYIGFYRRHGNYSEWKKTYHHYPRIVLTSTDKQLVRQVETLLDQIQLGYFTRTNQRSDGIRFNITSVGEERLQKFVEKVDFKNPVKRTRYQVWKEFGFCPTNTSLQERYKMLRGDLNPEEHYTG